MWLQHSIGTKKLLHGSVTARPIVLGSTWWDGRGSKHGRGRKRREVRMVCGPLWEWSRVVGMAVGRRVILAVVVSVPRIL